MKLQKNKLQARHFTIRITMIIVFAFLGIRCQDDVKEWETETNQMVITDYVLSVPVTFSEFGDLLVYTGIDDLLRVRGPFTLLLPTNEAMEEYYASKGVSSYSQLEMQQLHDLVYNHILQGEVTTGSIGLGKLLYKNGLGDFVASDLPGSDILLNKKAIIIKRDIEAANGIVQHIDHVLEPVTASVYDVLMSYDGYTIFLQGLDRSGLADTLKMLNFPYGNTFARNEYTILAVPDTLYNRMGVQSVDDLIALYSEGGDLTNPENGFYQYMEYHCLSEANYFSDLAPRAIYYLISNENYLEIRVEEDFKINKTSSGYTGFYFDLSNIPAKNGTVHTINSMLPKTETALAEVLFQTTDYFDLHQGPYYLNYYQRFYDGQNTFKYIKWDAEFLQYYLKTGHYLMDDDCLNLMGHFWVEITTPKIRKGKYELSTFMFFGGWSVTAWYIDGVYLGQLDPADGSWGGPPLKVGDVEFTETESHTIRLESLVPGGLFWDYVKFTPI
jgi:uncharacterized surface protein with fasciclin (FAS1) repeats